MKTDTNRELRGIVIIHPDLTVRLKSPVTIIGRERADIIISDPVVSASHCQIQEIAGGEFVLFDMNSTNGTYVNNKKVIKTKLQVNDIICIGNSQITFRLVSIHAASQIPFFDKSLRNQQSKSIIDTMLTQKPSQQLCRLKIAYPNGNVEILTITNNETLLGQDSMFGNFACDNKISGKHVLIRMSASGKLYAEDQNSKHGTFVNDKKISSIKEINQSDYLKIGSTIIKLMP
ncbi:MAG: FHA domain-containing protein [Pseudomonadota bacterium]|nr:FHA domain-containing protein [Pseudomonadota bacterium]